MDGSMELRQLSCAAVELLREIEGGRNPVQRRIVVGFVKAIFSASRAQSGVHLSDLAKINDAQFENVVAALCYVRRSRRYWNEPRSLVPMSHGTDGED